MEQISTKSNESCLSTTGTPASQLYSDTADNNLKYINLNFDEHSESSGQAKETILEYQRLQNPTTQYQSEFQKNQPNKILPCTLPLNGIDKNKSEQQIIPLKEKSLFEMGYKSNEVEGWENIVQPPKEDLFKLLKNMIDNHIKPSVQIRIGQVTFNCHMMVLQCYSDFFMDCNNEILIQLPEEKITPAAFMMVYDWMLSPQPLVQREGILELFNAANFLRIKDLINQCWLCLDDDVRFREDTAFLLYLEARNFGLESLEQLMLMRICKFFLTLVASKEFLSLNAKEICTLLSSNTIGVNSEIEIFMSVVRWLSYNWPERESHMMDVVNCVRFSLMPPWFLVTLNKNTDCLEIDRIIEHSEVKKMINDGITYTTTQLYYGENREEFLHFLERYQLVAPMQRQWVYDKECNYHHRLECPNMQYITYKSFLEYLEMIRTIGKDYWRTLEMDKGVVKSMHCFLCTDCRKTTESNPAIVFTKKSRDRGIQCTNGLRKHKGKDYNKTNFSHYSMSGKNSIRRTPLGHTQRYATTVTGSQTINSINNDTITETETTIDFKYPSVSDAVTNLHLVEKQQQQQHQPETILCDDNNHQQQQQQREQQKTEVKEQHIIDCYASEHIFSNIIVHNDDKEKIHHPQRKQEQQQQLLSKQYQQKQCKHNKKQYSKTQSDNCCLSVIYKRASGLMVDVSGDSNRGQHHQQQQEQQKQKESIIGNNHDDDDAKDDDNVEHMKQNVGFIRENHPIGDFNDNEDLLVCGIKEKVTSNFVDDVTRISNHKILVFGGIDPYCLHCQHVQQLQQQQQQRQHHQMKLSLQQQKYYQQLELLQRKRVLSIDNIIMNKTKTFPAKATTVIQQYPSRAHQTCAQRQTHFSDNKSHHHHRHVAATGANKILENFGDHVLFYDIDAAAMEWRHLSHIPFGSRHHHAVVVCNGLIYVIGGTRTSFSSNKKSIFEKSIWCFNPQTIKWTLETNLPEARRDFAVIAIDLENIKNLKHEMGFYIIGGEGVNGQALNSVWFYNIKRKIWIKKPSLNIGRYGLAAALVNNEIWVAGGIINDNNTVGICGNSSSNNNTNTNKPSETINATTTSVHVITDTIEIYNLKCIHCEILANNHTKGFLNNTYNQGEGGMGKVGKAAAEDFIESGSGAVLDNGVGDTIEHGYNVKNLKNGSEIVNVADVGDCNVGQWIISKLHLRIPRLFGKFCKMSNGEVYLVGGIGYSEERKVLTSLTDIDVFNGQQHKWEHVGDLNLARHGHDVAKLNDHCIVVIGGVSTFEKCTLNKVEAFCTKTRKSLKDLPDLPWPVSGCAAVIM